MQIAKHKVVTIDYTLTDDEGNVIDSSQGGEPLAYIQGTGNIIIGLERALEGKRVGERVKVAIQPKEGYGERDDNLTQTVARELFADVDELQVGMQFHASNGDQMQVVTIVEIEGNDVTVDANHPLAGVNLNFDVHIREIRDASEEELDHGHVHGAGGHHH